MSNHAIHTSVIIVIAAALMFATVGITAHFTILRPPKRAVEDKPFLKTTPLPGFTIYSDGEATINYPDGTVEPVRDDLMTEYAEARGNFERPKEAVDIDFELMAMRARMPHLFDPLWLARSLGDFYEWTEQMARDTRAFRREMGLAS